VSQGASYRQILRSTTITGAASVLNILTGLVRIKVAAILLGPAGVGLIGLFQNMITAASMVSSLGLADAGTRQIAQAAGRSDERALGEARRALLFATIGLGGLGAAIFWLARPYLAGEVLGDRGLEGMVGWLSVGVALTVVTGSRTAILNGMRRIGDLARMSILSALLSTVAGICALSLWGEQGIVAYVLSVPAATLLVGHWLVRRLPRPAAAPLRLREMLPHWNALARLGVTFVVAGAAASLAQLAVRTMVERRIGIPALGHFHAAWTISMTYISFILGAMGMDYYPRLTAAIARPSEANRMVNEQTEVALLLAGPAFVAMIGFAPWVITLLYSPDFGEAAGVLRWQVLGDILKVASWPMGFMILAAGDGRTFMLLESMAMIVFAGMTWILLPVAGIGATGIAFAAMYALYLPAVFAAARAKTGFAWRRRVTIQIGAVAAAAVAVLAIARYSQVAGAVVSGVAASLLAAHAFARLSSLSERSLADAGLGARIGGMIRWFGGDHGRR
jgi:PST family polysaccharide transporter